MCGDGVLAGEEECDDGNTAGFDGCSADCSVLEAGWTCSNTTCVASYCSKDLGSFISFFNLTVQSPIQTFEGDLLGVLSVFRAVSTLDILGNLPYAYAKQFDIHYDSGDSSIFSELPYFDSNGTLHLRILPFRNGISVWWVSLVLIVDGIEKHSSMTQPLEIIVNPVNSRPNFDLVSKVTLLEDSGFIIVNAASNISAGGKDEEEWQQLSFIVAHLSGNASIFVTPPALDRHGRLVLETQPDANGETFWSVTLIDDGGDLNGGVNNQSVSLFVIDVLAVNDAPSFFLPSTVLILEEDEDKPSVVQLATNIAPGPWNELDQNVAFIIAPNTLAEVGQSSSLFIFSNGSLVLKHSDLVNAQLTLNISLVDSGDELHGGKARSRIQQVVADIVLRAPAVNLSAYQTGPQELTVAWSHEWLGSRSPSAVRLAFSVVVSNCSKASANTSNFTCHVPFNASIPASNCSKLKCHIALPFGRLLHASTYHVEVIAVNRRGNGKLASDHVLMISRPSVPLAPQISRQMLVYPHIHSVFLQWEPPHEDGDGSQDAKMQLTYEVVVAFGGNSHSMAFNMSAPNGTTGQDLFSAELRFVWQPDLQRFLLTFGISAELYGGKGDQVTAQISAKNSFWTSAISEATFPAITLPSSVLELQVNEIREGAELRWLTPEDNGSGTRGKVGFLLNVTTCGGVTSQYRCTFQTLSLDLTSGPSMGKFAFNVSKEYMPIAAEYSFNLFAFNTLGKSLPATTSADIGLNPVIIHPSVAIVYLMIPAAHSTDLHIWAGALKLEQLVISVANLPWQLLPALAVRASLMTGNSSNQLALNITGSQKRGRELAINLGEAFAQVHTCATATTLCSGSIRIAFLQQAWKDVSLPIVAMVYPQPYVEALYAATGPEGGGTLVRIVIVIPHGPRTMQGAGLLTFADQNSEDLSVKFSCAGGERAAEYLVLALSNDAAETNSLTGSDWIKKDLTVLVPRAPCNCPAEAQITVFLSGSPVLTDDAAMSKLVFQYVGMNIESITPVAGITCPGSGGVELTLLLSNLGSTVTDFNISVAGIAVTMSSSPERSDGDRMVLKFVTPEMPVELQGPVNVEVLLFGGRVLQKTWQYLAAPLPVIEKKMFLIDGYPKRWMRVGPGSSTVRFTVSNLLPQYWYIHNLMIYRCVVSWYCRNVSSGIHHEQGLNMDAVFV